MKKQIFTFLSALILMAGSPGITAVAEGNKTWTVGICQFTRHNALDAATQGFKDSLTEKLGSQVIFDEQNAQGDYATCTAVINRFVTQDVDLILANATAALQTAVTATDQIPILGTSITEYGAALQMDHFDGTVGGNVSGTSDLAPLNEQAAMIYELFPDSRTVGLLYCSAEPNSEYQIDVMETELEALGYECSRYAFSDSNDISSVTLQAAAQCDVIYVPTDNAVASNAELIANICVPDGIPVIAGEESTCLICGVATLSIDYYDLGYKTGDMAARILTEEADISEMPIEYADTSTKRYNQEICEKLGIDIPDDYELLAAE